MKATSCYSEKYGFASVRILDIPINADKLYTYSIPQALSDTAVPGSIVTVPFGNGNRELQAVIISLSEECQYNRIKPILSICETALNIRPSLLGIASFIKDTCFCTYGEALKAVLPPCAANRHGVLYYLSENAKEAEDRISLSDLQFAVYGHIKKSKKISFSELIATFGGQILDILSFLEENGFVCKNNSYSYMVGEKTQKTVSLLLESDEFAELVDTKARSLTEKQMRVLKLFSSSRELPLSDITEFAFVGPSVVKTLEKNGILKISDKPVERNPYNIADVQKSDFRLSDEQDKAFRDLYSLYCDNEPKAALLHGVTGSGKTNVLIKLIEKAVLEKKSAIVLVPEISLTSQTVMRFASYFGDKVNVLHSGLSVGERHDAWRKIANSDSCIVIGTRSAVFAPVNNLGLIVLDEEHDSSFKSDMSPRFHARDIARYRCATTSSLMVLSSATPSVESYYKAKKGIYSLITLKSRYGKASLPEVVIHNMKDEPYYLPENVSTGRKAVPLLIGSLLKDELEYNIDNSLQSILFINRRGYQSAKLCRKCGNTVKCPNCSVSLTFHKDFYGADALVCHYCSHYERPTSKCPVCGEDASMLTGSGIQLLEENLKELFPQAKVVRMDADTTFGKFGHDKILNAFRNKEADILIGTQMVTKGHDFPEVSLVGVISADSSLYVGDYRANEKTFSMITQVMGRAGRDKIKGRAVIQTYTPDNETLILASLQDYEKFYEGEIELREATLFPPFCDIILVQIHSEHESMCFDAVKSFKQLFDSLYSSKYNDLKMILYGPYKENIYKFAGKYRFRFLIKVKLNKKSRAFLQEIYTAVSANLYGSAGMTIDVNPTNV